MWLIAELVGFVGGRNMLKCYNQPQKGYCMCGKDKSWIDVIKKGLFC